MSELPLKPCSLAITEDGENDVESKFYWDSHGLQADARIPIRNLDAFKKYKVSDVSLYEVNSQRDVIPVGAEDSLFEYVSLRPNRVYTKSQLLKELETLSAASGVFENVDLLAGTLPDGTIRIGIFIFSELSASAASPLNPVTTPIMSELPLKPCENEDESKFDWDSHGLQADATIPVRNLDAFKKYKVSYVYLYEVNCQRDLFPGGAEDSLFECISLRPNRVYTKSQLLKELETLSAAWGVFENVDLLAGTLPDGTIRIGIFIFSELSASAASPLNTVITPIMSELPLKPCENDDKSKFDWDSHGLKADATIPVQNLDAFKKYKVSYVYLYVVNSQRDLFPVGVEDSLFDCVSLRPKCVCTKSQLLKELETLSALGVFENVDLMAGTHPDGTICIAIYISEWEWLSANSIKCINVGLLPPSQPMEMSPNMTDEREQMEYIRSMEREYNRRVDEASSRRPCLLPKEVEEEVSRMLAEHNSVSSRLLNRVRDRVQKWYHDQGYACAQVVNFGNLNTKEVVCEVMEGDITQLVIQFQDKLGNPVEGNTHLEVVERELHKEMQQGHVFNTEAAKRAMANILSLDLFSNIEIQPRLDENNEGGLIVEVKLEVPEQESALSGALSHYWVSRL